MKYCLWTTIQKSLFVRFFYFQCEFMFCMNLHDLLHTRRKKNKKKNTRQTKENRKENQVKQKEVRDREKTDVSDSIVEIDSAYRLFIER